MHKNHLILGLTLVAVASALVWRSRGEGTRGAASAATVQAENALPRFIELGSDSCASCRAMIPVLAELRATHAEQLQVDFIDVWKFPELAKPFAARVIPTQVFLAPDGTELARHQGFYATEAIRERWAELGFALQVKDEGQQP